ncbi:GFA family protein [Loktanella sp. IMCC34160]|uniref:GFA family protein n=1 Tax=Loktanella sp. IMCC34160 TaxID=2510646 RepID=UPI00101BAC13|nr:GFA family protein [Loktanella sp. IMCC34160]RYG90620.1 GFA family protein [Loktanella sp. IMCC34160]
MIEGKCHCGAVQWRFDRTPEDATVCNCTVCRRYGVIWAYDWEGEAIHTSGPTHHYRRADSGDIEFHFCPTCGCVSWWRGHEPNKDGRTRIAVNLRLAEPEVVAHIPVDRFDGLVTFDDTPRDGRCVADFWA